MVVTVEPGIYFSSYALQHFYLPSPIHSKYINIEVLERYLPVGGVRIEDDVLITSKGYENLTTAPKGDAMFDIIRSGKPNADVALGRKSTLRGSKHDEKPHLRRAPGIPTTIPDPILRPLARATTMPEEIQRRGSADFEPFQGPSLFSNFKRSMTTDENIQRWRESQDVRAAQSSPDMAGKSVPVCGESTPNARHIYLSNASTLAIATSAHAKNERLSSCKNCMVLVQTLARLRQNLSTSSQNSPKMERKPDLQATTGGTKLEQARLEDLKRNPRTVEPASKTIPPIDKSEKHIPQQNYRPSARSASPSPLQRVRVPTRNDSAPDISATIPLGTEQFTLPSRPLRSFYETGFSRGRQTNEAAKEKLRVQAPHQSASNTFHWAGNNGLNGVAYGPLTLSNTNESALECARKEIADLHQRLSLLKEQSDLKDHRQKHKIRFDSLPTLRPDDQRQQQRQKQKPVTEDISKTSQKPDDAWKRAIAGAVQLERRQQLESQQRQGNDGRPSVCLICGPFCHCRSS